ncbi:MAG: acetyl-CoA hydrolase/transferase family protein [Propionibacteriaceae bacterium]|jgi:succinyl-CoA:acetate CoA-transferase|nr:acetyl-CoA hydrolase/transferase family protein [Propionibacteriaceae bacterium]
MSRIRNPKFQAKVMSATDAAAFIKDGDNVGVSGFTGSGYPKEVPGALADRINAATAAGEQLRVGLFTGASTAPELDGALGASGGTSFRTPYQSDPHMRNAINKGITDYADIHLSHSGPQVRQGFLGNLDVAIVEVTAITESGELVPSSSVGNNNVYIDCADKVILEVNSWQSEELEGMHDIYYGTELPPNNVPIPIVRPGDRIGGTTLRVDPSKVVAVVETNGADRNTPFKPLDEDSKAIAGHFIDFLNNEVKQGRLPKSLLPLQSGVGNIANAVLAGLLDSDLEGLTSFTEVIQDGMVDLLDSGKLTVASATAFSLSPEYAERMNENAASYRQRIVLRPQEISNNPEPIRRMGVISCNGLIEADIYGNVNSTHIMGSKMQNGIGGSGDFTRNAYISCFVTPSVAKGGDISCIVPMVSHHDHTEHDVMVVITEQGLADLRHLAPRKRARLIIENCAHPDFKDALLDYLERAEKTANSLHTPHDLREALSWHVRCLETGSMRA